MKEILDQKIPETSRYAGGKLRGVSLRQICQKPRLVDRLIDSEAFRKHHKDLFEDLRFIRQVPALYGAMGLRSPLRGRW